MYKLLLRPILFLFDPESVHHFTFKSIKISRKIPGVKAFRKSSYSVDDKRLERELFGLKFKNPVGIAAGFDKNALLLNELEDFGFGFVEIGTLTPKPQTGNPRPRLFRLKKDKGIINRMGFNNEGVDAVSLRLKDKTTKLIIGGNIGKNTATHNDDAKEEKWKKMMNIVKAGNDTAALVVPFNADHSLRIPTKSNPTDKDASTMSEETKMMSFELARKIHEFVVSYCTQQPLPFFS